MAIERVHKVTFAACLDTPSSRPKWDWVCYHIAHVEAYLPDYGIWWSGLDLLFHLGVWVATLSDDRDLCDEQEGLVSMWYQVGLWLVGNSCSCCSIQCLCDVDVGEAGHGRLRLTFSALGVGSVWVRLQGGGFAVGRGHAQCPLAVPRGACQVRVQGPCLGWGSC